MKRALLLAALALPAAAAAPADKPLLDPVNLKVVYKLSDGPLRAQGQFVVQSGAQASYTLGGETPVAAPGGAYEWKRFATVVNLVAAVDPSGRMADVQCQLELTGPQPSDEKGKQPDQRTFQYQTSFRATLGKSAVLVDEPGRRAEILIERAP